MMDFLCGVCTESFPRDQKRGNTPFGLPVCGACTDTFPACTKCEAVMEPHQHGTPPDQCVVCAPNGRPGRKYSGIRQHPSSIALEKMDQECADRIAREK